MSLVLEQLTSALADRYRIERELGQQHAEEARQAYRRFLELYDAPMPSQRHLVEQARKVLDRLSGVREIPTERSDS